MAVFFFLELAAAISVSSQKEFPLSNFELLDKNNMKNICGTIIFTLFTFLVYIYVMLTLCYVLLMDSEEELTRLTLSVGKIIIVIALGCYTLTHYFFLACLFTIILILLVVSSIYTNKICIFLFFFPHTSHSN